MTARTAAPARRRRPRAVAAALSGGVAIALSLAGQFYAATDHAAAVSSGHPKADAPLIYLLAVMPSALVAVLAVGLGAVACLRSRSSRAWGSIGIVLGLIAVVLSAVQVPADQWAEHWIEPHSGGPW